MGKPSGRTALVTGASRGIGEHCARALASEGARVAVAARSVGDIERVARDLDGGVALESDLSVEGAAVDLAQRAVQALGGVDVLVNNAGVAELPAAERSVLQVNYIAPLELTNVLAPQMGERGHGR